MKEKITAGRVWGAIYPLFFFQGTAYVLQFALIISLSVSGVGVGSTAMQKAESVIRKVSGCAIQLTLLADLICAIIMLYLMYSDRIKKEAAGILQIYEKVKGIKFLLVIPFSIFTMLSANYFVSLITMFMPKSMVDTYNSTSDILNNASIVMLVVAVGIVGPIAEELINRGVVYNRFKGFLGTIGAAVVSSLLFGIGHGNFVQAPYAFIVGLAAVYVYEKYKSLFAPIILHMTANLFSVCMTVLARALEGTAENIPRYSDVTLAMAYIQNIVIFGVLALIIGVIIEKSVKAKEIK